MGHTNGFGDSVVGQAAASDFPSTHEMQTAVVIVGSIGAAAFLIGAILLMRWACWRGSHQGRARDPSRESFVIPAPGASTFLFGNARAGAGPVSRQSGSSEGSSDLKEKGSMMIPIVVVSPDDSVSVALSFQSSVKSELPVVELSAVKLDIEACLDGSPSLQMERSHSNESSRSSTSAGLAPMTPQPSTDYAPSLPAGPDGSASPGSNGGEGGGSQCGTVGLHTALSAWPAAAAAAGGEVVAGSTLAAGEPQLPIGFILRPLAPAVPAPGSQEVPHSQSSPLNRAVAAAAAAAVLPRRRPAPIPEDIHPAVRYEEEDRRRRLARADPLTHRSAMGGFALGMMLPCMMF